VTFALTSASSGHRHRFSSHGKSSGRSRNAPRPTSPAPTTPEDSQSWKETTIRHSTFPQFFDGNVLGINVFLPRNQNPLMSAIDGDPRWGAPFADAGCRSSRGS
jgi:hypothetical protein